MEFYICLLESYLSRCCCHQVASVVSDSVRLHRQPTRLPHPWNSPGKNTGVGCYFLLQCMKVKSESEVAQSCLTLRNPMDCNPPGSSIHGIFQAGCTGVGINMFTYYQIPLIFIVLQSVGRAPLHLSHASFFS